MLSLEFFVEVKKSGVANFILFSQNVSVTKVFHKCL